jgi:coenzyme A diphosphatase NUDT7
MKRRRANTPSLPQAVARLRALPRPSHLSAGATFPPRALADIYNRGDMAPLLEPHSRVAAVLVALVAHPERGICVLLTRRTSKLRKHAGQVAFPGGKRDRDDATDVDTAFREADEEVGWPGSRDGRRNGVHADGVTFVCQLERLAQPNYSPPMLVTPVVATLDHGLVATLRASPDEVDAIFLAPLAAFLNDGAHHTFKDMDLNNYHGSLGSYRAHHFDIEWEGHHYDVWGQTADILMFIASVVYNRHPNFEMKKTPSDNIVSGAVPRPRL